MGLVAPGHMGSSLTRARTRVLCIGRQNLNHCATMEVHVHLILMLGTFFLGGTVFMTQVYFSFSIDSITLIGSSLEKRESHNWFSLLACKAPFAMPLGSAILARRNKWSHPQKSEVTEPARPWALAVPPGSGPGYGQVRRPGCPRHLPCVSLPLLADLQAQPMCGQSHVF